MNKHHTELNDEEIATMNALQDLKKHQRKRNRQKYLQDKASQTDLSKAQKQRSFLQDVIDSSKPDVDHDALNMEELKLQSKKGIDVYYDIGHTLSVDDIQDGIGQYTKTYSVKTSLFALDLATDFRVYSIFQPDNYALSYLEQYANLYADLTNANSNPTLKKEHKTFKDEPVETLLSELGKY